MSPDPSHSRRVPQRARPGKRAAPRVRGSSKLWMIVRRLFLAGVVVGALAMIYLDAYIQKQFSGKKWAVPAMVYARPMELYAGASISLRELVEELNALGYRETPGADRPGTYAASGRDVRIGTRGFRFWDGMEPGRRLRVRFDGARIDGVLDGAGTSVAIARLEPVHIGGIYPRHNEDRILVRASDVPPLLIKTLFAVEDRNFMQHHGISLRGITRALLVNVRSGASEQGGSTLTQQLVKNFFLTPERSIKRKLIEMAMAIVMEMRYSKQEILEAYLNEIYLGQDGHRAIHGFGLASHYYFNRPADELEPQQIALLIALVRGPSYYDPWRNPERALARRNRVLQHLVEEGEMQSAQAARLAQLPLDVGDRSHSRSRFYPAYLDLVRRQLRRDYSDKDLSSEGLQIFTGLDPAVQRSAERALQEGLARIEKNYAARGRPQKNLEGAVIVTRVDSGEVLAVVGGRHSRLAGFNRALDAVRPVGSLMKPAVYLSALATGRYTLLTPLDDSPLSYTGSDRRTWSPRNYDRESHGMVRLHSALAHSYNQSTARLGLEIGIPQVVDTIHRLGVERPIAELPSVSLGAVALNPLEVAGMYQTIASNGFVTPLRAIRDVLDSEGQPLTRYPMAVEQKLSAESVYLLQYAMKEVVREGTARYAYQRLPPGLTVAGKTGTTDDQRDSWFAGFAGDLLVVVWVGRDDNGATALTGATGALPIWTDLMSSASRQALRTALPEGVNEFWIDETSGGLSGDGCPNARLVPFLAGTEPRYEADCTGPRHSWPWSRSPSEQARPRQPGDAPARATESPRKKWWERWFGDSG